MVSEHTELKPQALKPRSGGGARLGNALRNAAVGVWGVGSLLVRGVGLQNDCAAKTNVHAGLPWRRCEISGLGAYDPSTRPRTLASMTMSACDYSIRQ